MSQTPTCPDVPDDVRALAIIAVAQLTPHCSDEADMDVIARAILADRASRALPSTALAARPEEGWQIKSLEWVSRHRSGDWSANTSVGVYYIDRIKGGFTWSIDNGSDHLVGTEDAAKSAAQAHHEARIRSALNAPSTPPTAGDGHD